MPRQTNKQPIFVNKNKLTTQFHTVSPRLFVADPAIFLASNSVWEPYFPLGAACLFGY